MHLRNTFTLMLAFVLLSGCQGQVDESREGATVNDDESAVASPDGAVLLKARPNREFEPPFVAVLANPDEYHGKKIRLEGFIHIEFDGNAIYFSKEHADHLINANGFWVEFDKSAVEFDSAIGPERFHRKWVLIEGVFDREDRGHFDGWSGTIKDIDRIYEIQVRYEDSHALSPQSAWSLLLAAMRNRDRESIERITTPSGLASLQSAVQPGDEATEVFSRLGHSWPQLQIRWITQDAYTATAQLGPEAKEAGLVFEKDREGWKLRRWVPGE